MDLLIILIIVFMLFSLYSKKKSKPKEAIIVNNNIHNDDNIYPYKSVNSILTPAEQNFYRVLNYSISDTNYYICMKVRLADIINVYESNNYQRYFNKISSKHIDFLLCDKNTFKPCIAIELDDSSHELDSRVFRDDFLNHSFISAELTLVRFKSYYSYSVSEIKEKLSLKAFS